MRFLSLTVLVVLGVTFANTTVADELVTPVLGRKIDATALVEFGRLSVADWLDELRQKHGFKVIFVPSRRREPRRGLNDDNDAKAVEFYADEKNSPLVFAGARVYFLEPYERLVTPLTPFEALPDRPYLDQPVLVVSADALRIDFLRELARYFVWKAGHEAPVTVGNKKLSATTARRLAVDKLLLETRERVAGVEKETDAEKSEERYRELVGSVLSFSLAEMEAARLQAGLLMDALTTLLQLRDSLRLSKDELLVLEAQHLNAFEVVLAGVASSRRVTQAPRFRAVAGADATYASKLKTFDERFEAFAEALKRSGEIAREASQAQR
jgi:hypothetical protein